MDHSSVSRFSTGVPVSATRCRAGSRRTARATALALFLTCCASSSTTRSHSIAASRSTSRAASWYVVSTRSASPVSSAVGAVVHRDPSGRA